MNHPYNDFLLNIEKPARYLGGEFGSIIPRRGDMASIALAFPDTYEIGMCYQGFHILYNILKDEPEIYVERVFSPWPDLEKELRKRDLPLVSLESAKPLHEFDVIGFSLQHEMCFTNVLAIIDLGKIPLKSSERSDSDPLIIAGGPAAFQPEPIADFIDLFVLGDGEEILPEILKKVHVLKKQGSSKRRILELLSDFKGIYVPSLVEMEVDKRTGFMVPPESLHVDRAPPVDLSKYPFPTSIPVPDTEIIFDRYSVEIARGCNGGCRFCQGGFIYRPLRLRSRDDIVNTVTQGLANTGFDSASLTSLSTVDYPGIEDLTGFLSNQLAPLNVDLSLSSLRAYEIPDALFSSLGKIRQSTLTFALEAGTQRLRDLINKNVVEENIIKTAERVFTRGWKRMKLYFMIGLPTETEDDVRAIIEVTKTIRDTARRCNAKTYNGVTASVSTFVPKPHTPFQWEPMISGDEIRKRQRILYDLSKQYHLSLKWHNADMSELEGVMARGDRRLSATVLRAYELGCRFDCWSDMLEYEKWRTAFKETGIDVARYLGGFSLEDRLPWDHLNTGVNRSFLIEERRKAFSEEVSEPCFFNGVCHGCGILCDLDSAKKYPDKLDISPVEKIQKTKEIKFRITFRRYGRLSYVSQLDLVHLFPKVIRRAGFKIVYSKGFKPKPTISYSPALPLGGSTLRDAFDVGLQDPEIAGKDIVLRLQEMAPLGLDFLSVRPLREWEKKLSRRIDAIDTVISFEDCDNLDQIEKSIESFLESDVVMYEFTNKSGRKKSVDLRSWVYEVRLLDRLDIPYAPEGPVLFIRTKPEFRPITVLEYLVGSKIQSSRIYRVDLLNRGVMGFTPIR